MGPIMSINFLLSALLSLLQDLFQSPFKSLPFEGFFCPYGFEWTVYSNRVICIKGCAIIGLDIKLWMWDLLVIVGSLANNVNYIVTCKLMFVLNCEKIFFILISWMILREINKLNDLKKRQNIRKSQNLAPKTVCMRV